MLNDVISTAGAILRIRLTSLRDKLEWTHSPLITPHLVPTTLWEKHWCARIAGHLHSHSATIGDTTNLILRRGSRTHGVPIYTSQTNASTRPSLIKHMLYWVGQIANTQGTKLQAPQNPRINTSSTWWTTLRDTLCISDTRTLKNPVSPVASRFVPSHRPGIITTRPTYSSRKNDWRSF